MRAFGLVGLLLAGVIVVLLTVKQFVLLRPSANNTTKPIENAKTVQGQANLNAIAQKLDVYYVGDGKYPASLDELGPDSQDFSVFEYRLCSSDKAIIKFGSSTMVLTNGNAVLDDSGGC